MEHAEKCILYQTNVSLRSTTMVRTTLNYSRVSPCFRLSGSRQTRVLIGRSPVDAVMIVSRAPERRGIELTDGLTSIVAPRPIWVDSSTSTKMGLDLCFTEAEFLEERKKTLDKIFRILPNKTDSHKAVDRYEKGFHWMFPSLHMPSLRAEQFVFLSCSPRSASF